MKSGGWVPISKAFVKSLPKDRPYTELEAAYSMQIDYDKNKAVTVTGYSHLWQWGTQRVYRFLKRMGITIEYPADTTTTQRQRGSLKIAVCNQYENGMIRLIDNRGLEHTTTMKPVRKQVTTRDNDKDKRKESKKPPPYSQVLALWRDILPELPQPRDIDGSRKQHFAARWDSGMKSESGLSSDTVAFWKGLFNYIRKSDFLMGNNDRNWKPNFDWVIKKENFKKLLEENYHK
jgi:hypothetical protein